jgi:hypothetical protein
MESSGVIALLLAFEASLMQRLLARLLCTSAALRYRRRSTFGAGVGKRMIPSVDAMLQAYD